MSTPTPQPHDDATALAGLMDGLLDAMSTESRTAVAAVLDHPEMAIAKQALAERDPDHFHLGMVYPFERMLDGLLSQHGVIDPRAKFIFMHASFIDGHFEKIFDRYEGFACCADKARWVVRALARSFLTGEPIVIDRNQEYTYHLPTLTFLSHEEIVEFFDGLYRFFYGRPDPYLAATVALHQRIAERRAATADGTLRPADRPTGNA